MRLLMAVLFSLAIVLAGCTSPPAVAPVNASEPVPGVVYWGEKDQGPGIYISNLKFGLNKEKKTLTVKVDFLNGYDQDILMCTDARYINFIYVDVDGFMSEKESKSSIPQMPIGGDGYIMEPFSWNYYHQKFEMLMKRMPRKGPKRQGCCCSHAFVSGHTKIIFYEIDGVIDYPDELYVDLAIGVIYQVMGEPVIRRKLLLSKVHIKATKDPKSPWNMSIVSRKPGAMPF